MTAGEAVALVLEAGRLGSAGEIFWLDMGEPMRILDLANRLRALALAAGLPDVDVDFIGLRPGEKQREELTVQGLELLRTAHPAICVARQSPFDAAAIRRSVSRLRTLLQRQDAAGALVELHAAISEYEPSVAATEAAFARRRPEAAPSTRSARSAPALVARIAE